MGTADEAQAQPRKGEDELPSYPGPSSVAEADQALPPAYDAGEGPSHRVSTLLLPMQPGEIHTAGRARFAPDDLLPPVVLVLDGQAIYAASDPAAAHLYELNRGITHLSAATAVVELARMEPRATTTVPRARHIYNLHHPPPSVLNATVATYDGFFAQPAAAPTRRLGPLGLKKRGIAGVLSTTAAADHWTVLPVDLHAWHEIGHPPFVAEAAALWDVRRAAGGGGAVKWVGVAEGRAETDVAMEFDDEDNDERRPRLIVTAALRRESMDTLVAMWCCRLWEKSVHAQRSQAAVKGKTVSTSGLGWKKFR